MKGSRHEPLKVKIDTAHFAQWLGTKPASGTYDYRSRHCASAQYLEAHGFEIINVSYWGAEAKRSDGVYVNAEFQEGVASALSQLSSEGCNPPVGRTRWGDAAHAVKLLV